MVDEEVTVYLKRHWNNVLELSGIDVLPPLQGMGEGISFSLWKRKMRFFKNSSRGKGVHFKQNGVEAEYQTAEEFGFLINYTSWGRF